MLEGFLHLFARRPFAQVMTDVADLLLVAYIAYRALLVLRGTRAMQMGIGLGVLGVVYFVSKWAELATLLYLLNALPIILIVVVVFQNDIRRGLMRVGARAFFAGLSRQQESKVIDEVVSAATELSRHRIGALIAFEQDANLDEFVVGQGTAIDAAVQRELLVSLFIPETLNKLHDGAVVIRNLRIAKAGVFFPMPDTKLHDKSMGSRHRAALGITEETDAVVVVVSEERGSISFCFNSNIVSNLDGASLRQALLGLFGQSARSKRAKTVASRRVGAVAQTGTGSFRVTTTGDGRPRVEPLGPGEGTGSPLPPPPAPETPPAPKVDKEAGSAEHKIITRPMAAATPIETPKPVASGAPAAPDETPNRPRED